MSTTAVDIAYCIKRLSNILCIFDIKKIMRLSWTNPSNLVELLSALGIK